MINFTNLFYYLVYFCYYLWVLLHFLVLFIGLIVLFQLTFTFIYNTFSLLLLINLWYASEFIVFFFIICIHFAIINYYHYCYDYTTRNLGFCNQIIRDQKVLANNVLLSFSFFSFLYCGKSCVRFFVIQVHCSLLDCELPNYDPHVEIKDHAMHPLSLSAIDVGLVTSIMWPIGLW